MTEYAIRIHAPASVVFDMLTDAHLLTEWMAIDARSEPSPGGAFRWDYENGDVVAGSYLEVHAPHRLVLAYGWEAPASRGIPPGSTHVEITLEEDADETLVRLVHTGLPAAEEPAHRQGWEFFLDRLAARLARERQADTGERDA